MNKPFLAFSAALALALVIGCGGGGGGGSSSSSTGTTTATNAGTSDTTGTSSAGGTSSGSTGTTFTQAQPGLATISATEVYTYTLTGSYTPSGGTTSTLASSSLRLEEVNPGSSSSNFLLSTIDNLAFPNNSPAGTSMSINTFVTQSSSDNSIVLQSVTFPDGTARTVTSPASVIPGTFVAGRTLTQTLPYNEGGSATVSFAVQSKQDVTVTYGDKNYETFPVTVSINYGSGYTRTGTFYYVPQLGTYIKAVETMTSPTASETVTASLTNANHT